VLASNTLFGAARAAVSHDVLRKENAPAWRRTGRTTCGGPAR